VPLALAPTESVLVGVAVPLGVGVADCTRDAVVEPLPDGVGVGDALLDGVGDCVGVGDRLGALDALVCELAPALALALVAALLDREATTD